MLSLPGWFGNYSTWQEAKANSTGYDSKIIVEKVKDSLLLVKAGKAAFERDSVAFAKFDYSWPVLSGLLWIAAQNNGKLNVIDFGGSLGSTWFQYRKFFSSLRIQWNIIEQGVFVEYGKRYFEDQYLHFFYTVEESMTAKNKPDVILLSSVLPYLENPYEMLAKLMSLNAPYMIIDKMPLITGRGTDLLTIQNVPPSVYKASYPAWFFDEALFLKFISEKYSVVEEFVNDEKANIPSAFKGYILKLNQEC